MSEQPAGKDDVERPAVPVHGKLLGADGAVELRAGQINVGGDVVGRDKVIGGDEVHGDKQVFEVEAGGVVVTRGGLFANIHLPRGVQIAIGVVALALVVLVIKAVTPAAAKVNTEFLFDASAAMADPERWQIAQTVFGDQATYATRREQLALRKVGGGCDVPDDPTVPLGADQADRLVKAVKSFTPEGDAALVDSIKAAADDLPSDADAQNTIILVSAGEDTCLAKQQKDPCTAMSAVADSLQRAGIKFTLHIVALRANEAARQQLTCLARANATGYVYEANSVDDLKQVLSQIETRGAAVSTTAARAPGQSVGVGGSVNNVQWLPDGTRVLAGVDNQAITWDLGSNHLTAAVFNGAPPFSTWLSPDGRHVATLDNYQVLVWNTAGEKSIWQGGLRVGYSLAWSPDGQRLASGSNDGAAGIWDVASGTLTQKLAGHTGVVYEVVWSPDGKRLASAGVDGTIRLWDVGTSKMLQVLNGSTYGLADGLAWSPDGTQFASIKGEDAIQIWDVATGREAAVIPVEVTRDGGGLNQIWWSPRGDYIATVSILGTVTLVDVPGRRSAGILTEDASSVAWSPDGSQLAVGGRSIEGGGRINLNGLQVWPIAPAAQ